MITSKIKIKKSKHFSKDLAILSMMKEAYKSISFYIKINLIFLIRNSFKIF